MVCRRPLAARNHRRNNIGLHRRRMLLHKCRMPARPGHARAQGLICRFTARKWPISAPIIVPPLSRWPSIAIHAIMARGSFIISSLSPIHNSSSPWPIALLEPPLHRTPPAAVDGISFQIYNHSLTRRGHFDYS